MNWGGLSKMGISDTRPKEPDVAKGMNTIGGKAEVAVTNNDALATARARIRARQSTDYGNPVSLL